MCRWLFEQGTLFDAGRVERFGKRATQHVLRLKGLLQIGPQQQFMVVSGSKSEVTGQAHLELHQQQHGSQSRMEMIVRRSASSSQAGVRARGDNDSGMQHDADDDDELTAAVSHAAQFAAEGDWGAMERLVLGLRL